MVSVAMDCFPRFSHFKGSLLLQILVFIIGLSTFQNVASMLGSVENPPGARVFDPIEVSPAVIPHDHLPTLPLPPIYPTIPNTYEPVLSGNCSVNFSAISSIFYKTASDCYQPLAALVGNVVCCPQFSSLLHIFQGYYSNNSDKLVLPNHVVHDCFTDIVSILGSRGSSSKIPSICAVNSSYLNGGYCPVKDLGTFEKMVNTSKLLGACSSVDPLKECCRPICQPAIMEAALQISAEQLMTSESKNIAGEHSHVDALSDCKGVVYSWMSRKLSVDDADTAFRILSACKVNKACPLEYKEPSEVIKACHDVAAPNHSCCSSINNYIAGIQKQMFITNRQAIICAKMFGSMLQKGGVVENIYELCDVNLKDFSLQAYNQQGCLLRSLPTDFVYDKTSGMSFTCDLNDNIVAPWPLSSSISSLSLCAPEMSLPALPTSETLGSPGYRGGLDIVVPIFSFVVLSTLLH